MESGMERLPEVFFWDYIRCLTTRLEELCEKGVNGKLQPEEQQHVAWLAKEVFENFHSGSPAFLQTKKMKRERSASWEDSQGRRACLADTTVVNVEEQQQRSEPTAEETTTTKLCRPCPQAAYPPSKTAAISIKNLLN
eukprot:TRINITY_DN2028_c0_g2_i1.p1 TRINITY_DN2028_c0_g2~~TRINITY_DN2028_c0_g2_i1.p1  ORF type:complete len:138 (-),score=24.45 TRINITY_DN2028_c0_g2_i1:345-758(-)